MTVEKLKKILNDKSLIQHIILREAIIFLKQPEIFNPLVNNIVKKMKDQKNTSYAFVNRAFIEEFSPYLEGTRFSRSEKISDMFSMSVATMSNILKDIRYNYTNNIVLEEPKTELTEEERMLIHMARMREAKAKKRAERLK